MQLASCSPRAPARSRTACAPPQAAAGTHGTSSATAAPRNEANSEAPVQSSFSLRVPELRTPLTSRAIARAMDKTIDEVRSTFPPMYGREVGTPGVERFVERFINSCETLDMQISRSTHRGRVAYQGCPGAYSEKAATTACPEYDPLPCAQFDVAFQALSQWMADRACLPIENSLGGAVFCFKPKRCVFLQALLALHSNAVTSSDVVQVAFTLFMICCWSITCTLYQRSPSQWTTAYLRRKGLPWIA